MFADEVQGTTLEAPDKTSSPSIGADGEVRSQTIYRKAVRQTSPAKLTNSTNKIGEDATRGLTPTSNPSANAQAASRARHDAGVVRIPSMTIIAPREIKLQEWEGQIQEIGLHYFLARLVDLARPDEGETEEAELPISDVAESERDLLVEGATFRWIIGYRLIDGGKERFSRVVIRRLPMWTASEIAAADKEALRLHEALFGNLRSGAA